MVDTQAVLSALETLNQPTDRLSFSSANAWLQDFQHSNEAWATCNVLLLSSDTPILAKVFAAQTFRSKVIYDFNQLDPTFHTSLRDTLLTALENFRNGPKNIVVQLSLALSGLALQFPAWQDVAVQSIIEKFGQDPLTVPTLLEFLTVLPEEICTNTKIPVTNDEYTASAARLLSANADRVLSLLVMYLTADGITSSVQSQVFYCLRSWVIAGEISVTVIAKTPFLSYAFQALEAYALFDAAVDLICDMIHETQEIDENMSVIQMIVPLLVQLKPKIASVKDDPDQVKGLAKIFSEAGEVYRLLILQHPETFFPIVEAIGEFSAYDDLDIVPITFQFWMRLAASIGKRPSVSPLLLDAYRTLMGVMIKHIHFPEDPSKMSPQEADDFRSFRHVMGDTLKDCCFVLGAEECLSKVLELLTEALAKGNAGNVVAWQEIEAPLFSLRSMGAEIDPSDDRVIPKFMDLMPMLPDHPRVLYSAILVISRYSEWTSRHPDYIPFQLRFISTGFESSDSEVPAAASLAMLYLCTDCKRDMMPYLSQLHSFLTSMGEKLVQDDRRRLYEAVAHVISAMPMEQAVQSLKTFSVDILGKIHGIVAKDTVPSRQEMQDIVDGLENLESMLGVVETFGEDLPTACEVSCRESWNIIGSLLGKYGIQYDIAERATRVIRSGLKFFGLTALPVIPQLLDKISLGFESTGYSSYEWIAGRSVMLYGDGDDTELQGAFKDAYERSTSKMVSMLQQQELRDIPDVLEDYLHLILQLFEKRPDTFFVSPAFPTAVRIAIASLTLVHTDVIFASLDILRGILAHDSLDPLHKNPPSKFPTYAQAMRQVVLVEGCQLLVNLLNGLVHNFPEESVPIVITIFRILATLWPQQLLSWLPEALSSVPMAASFTPAKEQLLTDVKSAISRGQFDKVKKAITTFHRYSARVKDRRRLIPID